MPTTKHLATWLLAGLAALICVSAALATSTTTIRSTNSHNLGRILEGPVGYTLYVFCPGVSTDCTGHSSSTWPPLIATGTVVAASGSKINQSKLSTRKLSDGRRQVTYHGQPLYLYKGDTRPGTTKGEQRYQANGAWFVISNTGRAVPKQRY